MSGAGDLKNSIQSLKRTLTRNNILQKMSLTLDHFQQPYLQKHNPEIFLKIAHYIMIQYSPILYAKILERFPNIKLVSDKQFMNGCYVCIRELFDTFPALTTDQFCSSKFLELKLKFIDELVNLVLIWLSDNKKGKVGKFGKVERVERIEKKGANLEEYEEPRKISIRATTIDSKEYQQPKSLKLKPQFQYQQQHDEEDNNQTDYGLDKYLNKSGNKPAISKPTAKLNNPISYSNNYDEKPIASNYSKTQPQQSSPYTSQQPVKLLKPSRSYPQQKSISYDLEEHQPQTQNQPVEQSVQSQINDLFELVGNVSLTVNELVGKFNMFQDNVSVWVKNINAKVDILESTVKTIKDNL